MEKSAERYATICPQCGSKDVSTDFSNAAAVSFGHFINLKNCNNCGHSGTFFPEVSVGDAPKTPTPAGKVKDKHFINPAFGRGMYYVYAVLTLFILIVFLLRYLG